MLSTSFDRLELDLDRPFMISRGTTETTENVVVRIADGEHEGVGGAAPSAWYGETVDTVGECLPDLLAIVESVDDPHALDRIQRQMVECAPEEGAARAAVSIALHDLVGNRLDLPLYRHLGLDPQLAPRSSFTIGIADPETMADRAADAVETGFRHLKVKLDGDESGTRLAAIREAAPDATIRVDANEAWTPAAAVEHVATLAEFDVEFVEQPVAADDPAGLARVHDEASIPIAVDESCVTANDVPAVADRADVVVAKLMKTGGIREALRLADVAHAHGMEAMLGCMVESNASITAGCHLAPAFEYVDLDGSLLLADDPFDGVLAPDGRIDLPSSEPGTGARRR